MARTGNGRENPLGRVFDVQRMSLHDGPGIRTTVFLKGCSMRCFWCHNPESWKSAQELQYFSDRCIGCGLCAAACPRGCHTLADGAHLFDRSGCVSCGLCAAVCPSRCLVWTGESVDADAIAGQVLRDLPFYRRSGGGVTFSGGEPLLQPGFVRAVAERVRVHGVKTAVETAAHVEYGAFLEVMSCIDLFLIDLKHPNPAEHLRATGVDNRLILDNIVRLDAAGIRYRIRIPVIPGVNDTLEVMRAFDRIFSGLSGVEEVELMPYHALGLNKLMSLGYPIDDVRELTRPSDSALQAMADAIRSAPVHFRKAQ